MHSIPRARRVIDHGSGDTQEIRRYKGNAVDLLPCTRQGNVLPPLREVLQLRPRTVTPDTLPGQ